MVFEIDRVVDVGPRGGKRFAFFGIDVTPQGLGDGLLPHRKFGLLHGEQ